MSKVRDQAIYQESWKPRNPEKDCKELSYEHRNIWFLCGCVCHIALELGLITNYQVLLTFVVLVIQSFLHLYINIHKHQYLQLKEKIIFIYSHIYFGFIVASSDIRGLIKFCLQY